MGEIYPLSARNIAWLGNADKIIRLAHRNFITLLREFPPPGLTGLETKRNFQGYRDNVRCCWCMLKLWWSISIHSSDTEVAMDELGTALLHADWWHRVWTLQEAVVCPTLDCAWGNLIVPWDLLSWLPEAMFRDSSITMMMAPIAPHLGIWRIHQIARLRSMRRSRLPCDLAFALTAAAGSDATDDRDHIFGILGLITPGFTIEIDPDYTGRTTTRALFIDVTSRWITHTQTFWLLYVAGRCLTPPEYKLPSWVPDYAGLSLGDFVYIKEKHAAGRGYGRWAFGMSCDGERMHLRAWIIGTVVAMQSDSKVLPRRVPFSSRPKTWLSALLAVLVRTFTAKLPLPWSQARAVDFCEAIIGLKQESLAQGTTLRANVCKLLNLLPEGVVDRHNPEGISAQEMGDYTKLAKRLDTYILTLTLGLTSQGYFVPIPMNTAEFNPDFDDLSESIKSHRRKYAPRPGDVIAVPLGSNVPVLLRPCDRDDAGTTSRGHYELLETCYLPALNDGSFVERMNMVSEEIVIV